MCVQRAIGTQQLVLPMVLVPYVECASPGHDTLASSSSSLQSLRGHGFESTTITIISADLWARKPNCIATSRPPAAPLFHLCVLAGGIGTVSVLWPPCLAHTPHRQLRPTHPQVWAAPRPKDLLLLPMLPHTGNRPVCTKFPAVQRTCTAMGRVRSHRSLTHTETGPQGDGSTSLICTSCQRLHIQLSLFQPACSLPGCL